MKGSDLVLMWREEGSFSGFTYSYEEIMCCTLEKNDTIYI